MCSCDTNSSTNDSPDDQKDIDLGVLMLMAEGYCKAAMAGVAFAMYKAAGIEITEDKIILCADAYLQQGKLGHGLMLYREIGKDAPADKLICCGDRCLQLGKPNVAEHAYFLAIKHGWRSTNQPSA